MRHLRNGTVIVSDPLGSHVVLPSGVAVIGRPHHSDGYLKTARDLGYKSDILKMCQDHDPLHAELCSWLGFSDSFSLRQAAGLKSDVTLALLEEEAVLMIQRFKTHVGFAGAGYVEV